MYRKILQIFTNDRNLKIITTFLSILFWVITIKTYKLLNGIIDLFREALQLKIEIFHQSGWLKKWLDHADGS